MSLILCIKDVVLLTRVSGPQNVAVQANAGTHHFLHSGWGQVYESQQATESVCQDAQGILHNSAFTGETIVEYPAIMV